MTVIISSVKSLRCVRIFAIPWTAARLPCSSPSPEACLTHIHRVSDAIQPSHPLLSPSPPAFSLSKHQCLFQWVSSMHQVAKVIELQLQHQSFQWISGLISFRIDWFDLLEIQGTPKILLQHHSSKTCILVARSFLYGPTLTSIHDYWKNHSLDNMDLCQQSIVSAF